MAEAAATQPETPSRNDRFVRWPLYWGLAVLAIWCSLFYWPVTQIAFSIVWVFWVPPFAFLVFCLLGSIILCAVSALLRRRWRRLASMLVVPVLLIAALPAAFATDYVANWLTFTVNKGRYEAEAREAAKAGKRYWFWDWGGNVMIGFNRTLVWDARDDATFPTAQRMESRGVAFPLMPYRVVQKLGPHFYLLED